MYVQCLFICTALSKSFKIVHLDKEKIESGEIHMQIFDSDFAINIVIIKH